MTRTNTFIFFFCFIVQFFYRQLDKTVNQPTLDLRSLLRQGVTQWFKPLLLKKKLLEPNADFNYHETDAYKNQRYKGKTKTKELEKKIEFIPFLLCNTGNTNRFFYFQNSFLFLFVCLVLFSF